jgi:NAD(P)-dependent dehydrogenase (short-subunit alcohol dehydrogenase family)
MKIDGSVALVTGANRGLGQVYARELVARGAAKVYGAARNPAAVTAPGVTPVALDITGPDRQGRTVTRPRADLPTGPEVLGYRSKRHRLAPGADMDRPRVH